MAPGSRGWISILISGIPFLFQACDAPGPAAPPQPVSALYECRGEPGYAGTWEEVIGPLRASGEVDSLDRLPCGEGAPVESDIVVRVSADRASDSAEEARVKVVILDGQCRLKREYADTLSIPAGSGMRAGYIHWNGRFGDGSKAPSGEYFINTVAEWESGRRDTSWMKLGMLVKACGD